MMAEGDGSDFENLEDEEEEAFENPKKKVRFGGVTSSTFASGATARALKQQRTSASSASSAPRPLVSRPPKPTSFSSPASSAKPTPTTTTTSASKIVASTPSRATAEELYDYETEAQILARQEVLRKRRLQQKDTKARIRRMQRDAYQSLFFALRRRGEAGLTLVKSLARYFGRCPKFGRKASHCDGIVRRQGCGSHGPWRAGQSHRPC